ncbi:MAG: NADP-dependent phosphogluconate dehydrogenase [Bacteroidota bacterium]
MTYDFGLVGLGVMGRNFILNVADNDFAAFGLDRDPEKVEALRGEGSGKKVDGTTDKEVFVKSLSTPRKIMMLVPAGGPVDSVINDLLPFLDEGDLLIDGGNSFYADTDRRFEQLKEKGIHFMGCGVSGGAKGARFGPSMMPGGSEASYQVVQPIFEAAAAKVNGDPCVAYLGKGSAGNYVKMVHNGIEYGMMQLISEAYDILKNGLGKSNEELHQLFSEWNSGRLQSFLIEITAEIFTKADDQGDGHLVDKILDKAKQKGTGKWTSQNAMDLGAAVPTIDAAVTMRGLSALKKDRVAAEDMYGEKRVGNAAITSSEIEAALYVSFIISYAQGMTQLAYASEEYGYGLDLETISKIWRGGCIIRSAILEDMRNAYKADPKLTNLLLDEDFASGVKGALEHLKNTIIYATGQNIPCMAMSASLNYLQAYTTGRLPLNLLQAQRDHFGSHTYERIDKEGIFHTEW